MSAKQATVIECDGCGKRLACSFGNPWGVKYTETEMAKSFREDLSEKGWVSRSHKRKVYDLCCECIARGQRPAIEDESRMLPAPALSAPALSGESPE